MIINCLRNFLLLLILPGLAMASATDTRALKTGEAVSSSGNHTGKLPSGETIALSDINTGDFVPGEWLHLGPATIPNPVYHDVPGISGSAWSTHQFLTTQLADYHKWDPRPGSEVIWQRDKKLAWAKMKPDENLRLNLGNAATAEANAAGLNNVSWSAV